MAGVALGGIEVAVSTEGSGILKRGHMQMDHWSDLFPIIFFPFKIIVLCVGMFFAIKWHYDQDKKKQKETVDRRRECTKSE